MNLRPSQVCGGIAVLAGLLVLSGWEFEATMLQSLLPGFPAAQPMTAVAMALSGGAMLVQGVRRASARRAAVVLASAVAVIALLNLAAYAGLDLGQDGWLFSDQLANQPGPYRYPGRMAEVTALCFVLVAFAILAKALRRMVLLAVAAATVAYVLGTVTLLAYLFDVPVLAVVGFAGVSLPTGAVLVVLSAGALAAEPLAGWPRRLTLDTPGGNLARVLLPLALIVPIGIGAAARIVARISYVPPDFRLVIVCAVTAVVLGAVVVWTARRIDGLDAARQRYRRLYEAQSSAHLVLTPDLTIEEASEAYLTATMTHRKDLVGKGMFEAFPADPAATGVPNLRASLERVLKTRAPDRMPVQKYDIRRPSGEFEVRWWSPLNTPVFGPDGEVRHIIHQIEDVTAEMLEREAAAEARAGEVRFRELADAIPGLVFEIDPAGSNSYVNEQYRAYTGLPIEALLGDDWRQVFHPDDRERAVAAWRAAVGSARPFEMECRIRRTDGAWRWFMLRTTALRSARGNVVRGIGVCTDIDDLKHAETALRASEERLRRVLETEAVGVLFFNYEGMLVGANEVFFKMTGWSREEVESDRLGWRQMTPPEWVAASEAQMEGLAATGRIGPYEKEYLRKNGSRFWILSAGRDLGDGTIVEFAVDIGARKQAEEAARRLAAIIESSDDAILSIDLTGAITSWNPGAERLYGYRAEEVIGQPVTLLIPEERQDEETGILERSGRGEQIEHFETVRQRKDGHLVTISLTVSPIKDGHGRIIGASKIARDITERKQAEIALRESEAQFRSMADSLPQLAWMADKNGWIYWYNRQWYEYTHTTLKEMEGWGWRKVHHPDHIDRVVARIRRSWETGEPWEDTFPLRRADGQYRWFLSRAVPIRDSEGRVTRWFGTNTDITKQRKREDLQKLLIREISHRVKNSLSVVSALLQLQARTLEAAPRDALEDASARVRTVATVHDQLWRQADANEVDLASFLSNLAAAIATAAPRHATVVEVEPAFVSADMAVPLGLLVNELVTNAYKYAYAPGEEGEVRVAGTHATEGRYRLEVSDLGRGLPNDFDIGRSRTNLGMRVITSMAAQLNGALTVSPAEPGTRFTLEFPLKESSLPAA